ncbi:MAG: hypothetical protein K2I27_12030, partial [Bacteroides sp.]|nr:hypothetical protein [Bacteroides sp.]
MKALSKALSALISLITHSPLSLWRGAGGEALLFLFCALPLHAQQSNNEALRKLQMAEFAISRLYVD